uniref:Suppressor of cytokine signaling 6 n=1 Tax=Anopheles dirus TaxID=7168 RepID=A0A182NV28_9DIPT
MEHTDGISGAAESDHDRPSTDRISKASTAPRTSSSDGVCRFNWFLSLRRKRSSAATVAVASAHGKNTEGAAGTVKDGMFTSDENNHNSQHAGGSVFYTLRKRFQKKFTSVKVKAFEANVVVGSMGTTASSNGTSANISSTESSHCNGTLRDHGGSYVNSNDFARIVIERHTQNPIRFSSPNANLPVIMSSRDVEPNTAEDGNTPPVAASPTVANEDTPDMDDMMADMRFDLLQYGWYWGKLTRLAAQKRLAQQVNGTFLVRDSQTEKHQFTVSFRSSGITLHCRIDFENNYWSFSGLTTPTTYKTMVDLIQDTMKKSQYGVIGYVKQDTTLMPPFPVRLTRPINRFYEVSSLQHLCRFIIRQKIDAKSIKKLPLPDKLKEYVEENFYDL